MKEKDFEVIVPAYDALEAELEDILGGGCFFQRCPGHVDCKPNISGNCAREGERPDANRSCCPDLIAVKLAGGGFVCMKP